MSGLNGTHRGYRHVAAGPIVAAAVGSIVLAFSLTPTFAAASGYVQQLVPATSAAVNIQEAAADGSAACSSSTLASDTGGTSCSGIDLYGGKNLQPGKASRTTVVFTNSGTGHAHSFTAAGGQCTQSATGANSGSATDLCDKFHLLISAGGTTVFDGTAAEFGRIGALPVVDGAANMTIPAGGSVTVTVTVTLSSDIDNSHAGLQIGQPITWTFQN